MNKKSLHEELESSTRWGCNEQPDLPTIFGVLESLPIKHVEMEASDTLYLELSRPMNQKECFDFAYNLSFDFPDSIEEKQTIFKLWWD